MPHTEPARRDRSDPVGPDELCVAGVPLFAPLSYVEQLNVASLARPVTVQRGEQIYAPGSRAAQLMVVHTGQVKISRISADGHEQIVRVLGPGDFVGESAFVTGARPDHFASALEDGSMCVFRHADLGRLVREHPGVGMRMLQAVGQRLEETEQRLAAAVSGNVAARVADYLLGLPGEHVDGTVLVTLPLAKKDIASLLDTTPESLSRQLRRLSQAGVIQQRGGRTVVLADVDALLDLSAGAG
ncbi:Crp/Fnr family transcriptional regulator [Ornithinimicrobium pratense]|uniref:Crp/Fnr family transcriptional regulator n=1 Tax=Ornithinimicrobium pratense TaxID=2593973 RepID=A0A5J6V4K4_9MICO|nr:Crp/Fnr family transcriptional regulator [Ornithinimicrobium pratense]QFG68106.1 Crp/Fnr family transcriptional regulator [Ornithinimicrobium pratense]